VLAGQERAEVEVLAVAEEFELPRRPGWLFLIGRFVRRKPLGAFGLAVVLMMAAAAAGSPWLSRYDAEETFRDVNPSYEPGSVEAEERLDSRSGPSW